MDRLFSRLEYSDTTFSPPIIRIYDHVYFPLQDVFDVLYPLFAPYYPYHIFMQSVYTSSHMFCAYDPRQGHCIACAFRTPTSPI